MMVTGLLNEISDWLSNTNFPINSMISQYYGLVTIEDDFVSFLSGRKLIFCRFVMLAYE